ncbi:MULTISPECIES: 16S rRNA (uracil(1498)-N(3))-methyltransferase [unclassified Facklamia]|uniref:16S rRNA (uracil(1498)-N(3))-methyltransferase n=1 Tax=Aerococcaceae TaxID=186827 RepID=UPI0013B7AE5C|nr:MULTISPECIES: 16S rRNA (uracil(1498)-N(3))-methyltransferase [unclassified Facklamia]MBS4460971.1 16S rRNA (uracil(1498)-N(3))-methyltransferase [Aerococcaceae bacterium zg-B36]NEW64836.1 16S rRNA (uracil(1498)-N(3))-methyltransferase [Facklamia sp. 252]NEW68158.1 16S rRNA (uracil(1498)-N(3))-methyltransferase [Facklamia sp. 253]QQD64989.1 16S rRNA (uracil(1498)-N(3))-methyltransferase [Aerococcaceae bacterium zg-252]
MQRYFVSENLAVEDTVLLSAEDSHHLLRVMRAKIGTKVYLVDGASQLFVAELLEEVSAQARLVMLELMDTRVELAPHIAIACGLSKNDKLEWIVQKATECGMHQFYPLALKRDVMKWQENKADKKVERLTKIAKEAAEQSHRVMMPVIESQQNLSTFIKQTEHYTVKLIAYEETAKAGEHQQLKSQLLAVKPTDSIVMVFGSEGGLAAEEVEQLTQAGFVSCSLGPRILRAETAPIVFLSAISYQLEL